MKKHLSLLLCLVMLVSMFSIFTVQSSAAPAALVWDFTKPESSAELMGRNFTKVADTYLGAVRTNIAHTQPAGTGSVTYDAVNKAIVMGTPADGTDVTTMNPYFSSKVYDIAKTDYSYLKIRFKLETSLPKVTLNLRGVHASGKWSNDALYTDVPQEQWVEAVFPLKSWTTAYANYPKNASNFWGSTYILQFGKGSSAYFDDDFKFTLQYIGFFKTKAEADGFTVAPTVEMKYDSIFAYNDGRVHNDDRNPSYAANPNFGTQTGLMVFDHAVDSMYFKPDYSKESASTSNNQVARANFVSENVLLGNNYKYVKIRYKIEADGLTGPVSIRLRDGKYSNNDYVTKDSPVNEWVEVVHPLTASAWKDKIIIGPDPSAQPFRVQLDWPTGVNVYDDPNFRFYVQYITFFTDKASADAYTYTPPAANGAPIIWNFDTHNAIPAYATDLTDAYVGAGAGVSTVVDFDRDTQSVSFTPNYSGTNGNIMRPTLYNTAAPIDGEAYPYVKVRYRLQCEASDSYVVYLRNNAWSINYIDKSAKNGDWVEAVVDMTADPQDATKPERYWYNTAITNRDDPNAAATWSLLFQLENTSGAGKNQILDDKDFRFDVQYIAFFATKEEAEAYTYTAPVVPNGDPIVWRFDTYNAIPEYATDLNDAYIHDVVTTDAIVDFDDKTKSVYLTPDLAGTNGSAMHVQMYNTADAIDGEAYPYVKIRYRLQCEDGDKYYVYLRNNAWSVNWIDKAAENGDWVEAVVDMTADAQANANRYWFNTGVINCNDPAAAEKWGLLLQIENASGAGKNQIHDDKNFRFDVQYIAFFSTEEEANDYIYTEPGATPVVPAVEMKLDNPNALKTHTDTTADLGAFYVSDYVVGDKGATYAPTGIMGYDADERAVYFTPDYYLNNRVTNPYMSRVAITPKSKTFSGAEYRYVKLRYKLVTDDPNVRMFLRDAGTWGEFDIHADKKTPINQWVEVVVDLWNAGSGWTSKTISPEKGLILQLSNNDKTVDNYDKDEYRLYLQYISFFQTKEEADAYTYKPTAYNAKPTGKSVVLPFDLPQYSYVLGGNRYTTAYSIYSHSFGADDKGTIAYDETEKAIYIKPSEELAATAATQSRIIIRGISSEQIKGADYPYVKLCYKLTNYTPGEGEILAIRDNKWVTYRLTEEPLKTGEWVTVTARMSALSSGSNWKNAIFGASTSKVQNDLRIQLYCDNPSTNITANSDARLYLKYVAFFQTQAEAEAFTYTAQPETPAADPIVWKFDNHNAVKASASKLGGAYVSAVAGANSSSSTFAYDKDEKAVVVTPSATGNSYYAQIRINNNGAAFAGKDYPVGKIRFKIEGDAAETYRVNFRSAAWSTHPIISSVKPGEWVEVTFDLTVLQDTTARQWFNTTVQNCGDPYAANNADLSKYGAILQFENIAGHNIHSDKNFRVCLQYLGFFPSEEAAKAHTYIAPATETGDAILWKFDNFNAVPAYALDLSDAYIANVGGSSTIVDFDEKTQSVTLTPNYGGASGKYMHVQLYNSAAEIKGEKYPYVKIRYRLQCEDSDQYVVYFRNNAWSINYIDKAAKNGDWVEVVVDMTADPQSTANRYWFNTGVTNCDDPSAAAKWGLLLQVENTSGAGKDNIHDDKNFRFDVQYIGFFSTKEEANAYTYTAPEVSAVPPVVMKFDTPNASSTITTETDYLSPFYASNILMGDKDANGNWPIGIMGYDAQERSIYFVNDAADNGKFPAAYMSRIYISSKNTAVQAEEYRYMKIRYKLVSDDPNVRVFLRDSKTWGSYDLFADRKTPVNEWVEVVVDLWRAGAGWNTKTLITPSNPLYLQFSNNNTSVNNYAKDDYRIYLQYISFFATEEEANAYTYTATDIGSLPNADDFLATDKVIVMPFDLPRYSYALGGNRYTSTYAIVAHSFGSDTNGAIKFDEQERAIYLEGIEPLATATQSRFVIRGSRAFSGADYPYVKLCYKITNYAFGPNDYLTFRNGSAWSTIQLSAEKLKADEWVTITANLNAMPGGSTWKSTVIGGNVGTSANDLRLQLYLNKPGANNITANPDARFYLKYIAFFQTQEEAENFDFSKWGKGGYAPESTGPDLWLQVLANKYSEKYTLTATATAGGAISNIGDTQVRYKKSMTYTITAAEGYTLTDVLVDGKSVGAVTEYTFESVKAAHTIHAVFTAKDGK